jgi:hypothetical protein
METLLNGLVVSGLIAGSAIVLAALIVNDDGCQEWRVVRKFRRRFPFLIVTR